MTLPPRASEAKARQWAEKQRAWIEGQLAKLPKAEPIAAGGAIPFRGKKLLIEWRKNRPRKPRRDGTILEIGGEKSEIPNRVVRWLKTEARARLGAATDFYAARANVEVAGISIGDARTRWGSCSSSGRIRYNWRLVMAPPAVLESVVAHEIAHRLYMNHSPDFHEAVTRIFGRNPKSENRWLSEHGPALYWVGCSS